MKAMLFIISILTLVSCTEQETIHAKVQSLGDNGATIEMNMEFDNLNEVNSYGIKSTKYSQIVEIWVADSLVFHYEKPLQQDTTTVQ